MSIAQGTQKRLKKMLRATWRAIDIRLVLSGRARCAKAESRAHEIPMGLMYDGITKLNTSALIPMFKKGMPKSEFPAGYLVAMMDATGELEMDAEVATYEPSADCWAWSARTRKRRDDDLWITSTEYRNAFREAVSRQAALNCG